MADHVEPTFVDIMSSFGLHTGGVQALPTPRNIHTALTTIQKVRHADGSEDTAVVLSTEEAVAVLAELSYPRLTPRRAEFQRALGARAARNST